MKALLAGGPAEGVIETLVETASGLCWTIVIEHVNCTCRWCKEAMTERAAVHHVYERRDDDVYAYRRSEPMAYEEVERVWR